MPPGRGVAVFDQEGGWPFGLETMMRDAVRRRDAHLLVRRGPIGTNVDYIISRQALTDDVSSDPLQRVSRVADASKTSRANAAPSASCTAI